MPPGRAAFYIPALGDATIYGPVVSSATLKKEPVSAEASLRDLARWLAFGAGLLVAAVVAERVAVRLMMRVEHGYSRYEGILTDARPLLTKSSEPRVVLLGSSLAYFGFSPDTFERALAARGHRYLAANLGVSGTTPDLLWSEAKMLAATVSDVEHGRDVYLVEWTPYLSTALPSKQALIESNLPLRARTLDAADLEIAALRSPSEASELLGAWALGLPGQSFGKEWVQNRVLGLRDATMWWLPMTERPRPELDALVKRAEASGWLDAVRRQEGWDLPHRGERMLAEPANAEQAEVQATLRALWTSSPKIQMLMAKRWDRFGWREPELDPTAIEHLARALRTLRTLTPHVYLVLAPRRPGYPFTELGRKRIRAATDRMQRELGVDTFDCLADAQDESFYDDPGHLNPRGARAFSEVIAARVAERLEAGR